MSSAKFPLAIKKLQGLMIKKIAQMVLDARVDTNSLKRKQWHRTPCYKVNISLQIIELLIDSYVYLMKHKFGSF